MMEKVENFGIFSVLIKGFNSLPRERRERGTEKERERPLWAFPSPLNTHHYLS